jgi:oligopeptide transport system substrate-binding protein
MVRTSCTTPSLNHLIQRDDKKATRILRLNFLDGDLPSLHPHLLEPHIRGRITGRLLFEGLTRINAKGEAELAGAKSVDISSDGLQYVFALENNRWSDGSSVLACHYEKAWKKALSPASYCPRADILYIIKNAQEVKQGKLPLETVGVKAIGGKTLLVELAYPSPHFLEFSAQCTYAPLHDAQEKEPCQFNGPFLVKEWKKGDHLHLVSNPYYWDSKHISLKQINMRMLEDSMTTFLLFEKKEVDWVGFPMGTLLEEFIDHLKQLNIMSQPAARAYWLYLNTTKPYLSSSSIRRALSLALNRSTITTDIIVDGQPLTKPIPSMLLPATTFLREDFFEARSEFERGLEELGLTKETFPILTISYAGDRKPFAEHIQEAWSKAFGIKIEIQWKEWNTHRTDFEKGLYEIGCCYNATVCSDPLELLERFASINPSNFSQWENFQYNEKISLAKQEKDLPLRMKRLMEAEQILMDQMPFIPISSEVLLFAHHPDLEGYVIDRVGNIDFARSFFKNN